MIKKLKRKKQRPPLLVCMIVVGMNLLTMIFAAVGIAAVRRCKWFPEISNLHGVKGKAELLNLY